MSAVLFLDHREASRGLAKRGPEAQIRRLIADWEDALCRRDLDGLMEFYSPDTVLFDVHPPFRVEGIEKIRELWEGVLPLVPGRFERSSLQIVADHSAAFAHWCLRPADAPERPVVPAWMRVSLPVDPVTNEAVAFSEFP